MLFGVSLCKDIGSKIEQLGFRRGSWGAAAPRAGSLFFPRKPSGLRVSRLGFLFLGTLGRLSRPGGWVLKKLSRKWGGFLAISFGGRSRLCIGFFSRFCTSPCNVSSKNVISSYYLQGYRLLAFFVSSSEFLAEDHSDWKNTVLSERPVLHFLLSFIAILRLPHYLHWGRGLFLKGFLQHFNDFHSDW